MTRWALGVLVGCALGTGGVTFADPTSEASPPPAAPPAAPAAAAPAASNPAPAAKPTSAAGSELTQDEKHFVAQGYKLVTRNGQRLLCRREEVLGSRIGGGEFCSSAERLKLIEQQSQEATENIRKGANMNRPGN